MEVYCKVHQLKWFDNDWNSSIIKMRVKCGALKIFYGNARPLWECKVLCACIWDTHNVGCKAEMAGEQWNEKIWPHTHSLSCGMENL